MNFTVEKLGSIPVNRLQASPTSPQWWAPLKAAARDAGDSKALAQIEHAQMVASQSNLNNDRVQRDALIPFERTIAYRPQITLNNASRVANYNVDYDAFGFDTSVDPRADVVRRYEMEVAGQVARFCCGVDPTTVGANIVPLDTKRGWYTIGFKLCWTDLIAQQYAGMFDYIGAMQALCIDKLEQARCEVAFYGDAQQGLRGLTQLPVQRLTLPKTISEMDFYELYSWWMKLSYYSEVTKGEVGIPMTHVLTPPGIDLLFSQIATAGNAYTTVGDLIAKSNKQIKRKSTQYMNNVGQNGEPAAFFYDRNSNYFYRDIAYAPMFLAPSYEGNYLHFQAVARFGELATTNGAAGLLVSNLLPKGLI